jgi:hypothetical protein
VNASVPGHAPPSALPSPVLRASTWLTLVALGIFVVAMLAAMLRYPGGSWTAPQASGFSLVRNFWCDLLRSQAINGADNGSSKLLASLAFGALGVGLWPYWWVAASVLPGPRARFVSRLGTISAACVAAMTLLPSDRFAIAHGAVALAGGFIGMWAAASSVAVRAADEPRFAWRRSAGLLALLFAAGNALLYVHVAYLKGPETVAQPIVQKLATLFLLTWMFATVRQARRVDARRVSERVQQPR